MWSRAVLTGVFLQSPFSHSFRVLLQSSLSRPNRSSQQSFFIKGFATLGLPSQAELMIMCQPRTINSMPHVNIVRENIQFFLIFFYSNNQQYFHPSYSLLIVMNLFFYGSRFERFRSAWGSFSFSSQYLPHPTLFLPAARSKDGIQLRVTALVQYAEAT